MVAGAGTFFFKQDKYRLYMNYSFRNEPANHYGTDISTIENTPRGTNTTGFHKMLLQFNPRFVWQARPGLFAGAYNYQILDLEYRHFVPLFHRRSVLGWTARTQIGFNDIPFTELPMFGSQEAYERGTFWSKLGFVVWGGIGTIGDTPLQWKKWKLNYGIGLRIQMQKNKNFRIDIGREPGVKGILFYMNMTEAF